MLREESECSSDEVFEIFGWSVRMDRIRNKEVLRRAGIERELQVEWIRVLWFTHGERMDEYRLDRRV